MRLGIVIPTLDEESTIAISLASALEIADTVCVSDGGSQDRTVEIADSMGALTVVGGSGRGIQLNAGAEQCASDLLLFLHADTVLPDGARSSILAAISQGSVGGGFCVHYETDRRLLRIGTHFINARTRMTGWPLGDQGQFATRWAFEAVGGYRPWKILEDLDFIRRLSRFGQLTIIPDQVMTSDRRFDRQGLLRTTSGNWLIWALYLCGVAPDRLARLYRHIR